MTREAGTRARCQLPWSLTSAAQSANSAAKPCRIGSYDLPLAASAWRRMASATRWAVIVHWSEQLRQRIVTERAFLRWTRAPPSRQAGHVPAQNDTAL